MSVHGQATSPGERARARRDRIACWVLGGGSLAVFLAYFVADLAGMVPRELSVTWRSGLRGSSALSGRYEELDPDLFLGVAIGDSRYRLNYATGHAIVTRPRFGIADWVVPERVTYQGQTFTVTALDSFALLYAIGVRTISLPPTLRYTNGAEGMVCAELRTLAVRLPDGSERVFPRAKGFDTPTLRRLTGQPPEPPTEEETAP